MAARDVRFVLLFFLEREHTKRTNLYLVVLWLVLQQQHLNCAFGLLRQ